jgi:hypothetical protein
VNHVLWNVATYEWKVHNGKIEIISFVVKFVFYRPSLSLSRCGSRYDAHVSVSMVSLVFLSDYHDLVDRYGVYVSQMTTDMFHLSKTLPGPFLVHDLSPGV